MLIPGKASLSLSGFVLRKDAPWSDHARGALEWACGLGYTAVQIDAAMPGLRPRELDQSARRDVMTTLRRRGTLISGLDLFIPSTHFVHSEHADRAVSAVRDAIELAGQWRAGVGTMPVSVVLPTDIDATVLTALNAAADRAGVTLADCSWPVRTGVLGAVGFGVDPAIILMSGADPAAAVGSLRRPPAIARLSDVGAEGRVEPKERGGTGRLDVDAYRVALSVSGYAGPLVCDLRGLRDQAGAATRLRRFVEGTPA